MICSTCNKNPCEGKHKICPSCQEAHRKYHIEHRSELLKRMRERYQNRKAEYIKNNRQTYWRLKREVFILLGDKCSVCGLSDRRALQIDHVNGGGTQEIQSLCPTTYFRKIISEVKSGSKKYQLLCANHNAIKRWESHELNTQGLPNMDSFLL